MSAEGKRFSIGPVAGPTQAGDAPLRHLVPPFRADANSDRKPNNAQVWNFGLLPNGNYVVKSKPRSQNYCELFYQKSNSQVCGRVVGGWAGGGGSGPACLVLFAWFLPPTGMGN